MNRDPMVIQLRTPYRNGESPRQRGNYALYVLLGVCAVVCATLAFVSYAWFVSSGQTEVDEMDIAEIVGDVGLLMLLPSDEEPTIATVTNLDSLKDQPFFKHAKIGDVVLMYPKSQRAILYSPSENMIIEVAPIVTGQ